MYHFVTENVKGLRGNEIAHLIGILSLVVPLSKEGVLDIIEFRRSLRIVSNSSLS